jgi:membrane peptidoglycan carboxypeptidase
MLVVALNCVLLGLMFLATCTAVPAGAALVALQAQDWMSTHTIDLPASGPLDADLPQTATITARNGTLLAEIEDVHYGRRTFVPLHEISRMLVIATMAVEDRRFYDHPGVDAVGLARALGTNAESGDATQGGSTIFGAARQGMRVPSHLHQSPTNPQPVASTSSLSDPDRATAKGQAPATKPGVTPV